MGRVLVADDEPKLGRVVAEMLTLEGHDVRRVSGGRQAIAELHQSGAEVVITDLKMPELDGMAVLAEALRLSPAPAVIVMTGHATAQSAVEAMKAGAADYLTKPFAMDELRLRVRRLCDQRLAVQRSEQLVDRLTPALVGDSPRMQEVLAAAAKVAPTSTTVLLLGESGTGKSQVARRIHYQSAVAGGPLVEVHCAALPETLLEGELFGHEKGAFTGAQQRRAGHLAAAEDGTLFLDEIGEVTPSTQVKLLRFLQDRTYTPLGTTTAHPANVRVIAATNRDLDAAVASGAFREDFFYRLNVFTIVVPPLRERREDILPLARRFLAARGLPPEKLGAAAEQRLLHHPWPGNVRELENALERALILSGEDVVEPQHLGPAGGATRARNLAGELLVEGFELDAFERELLTIALARAGGNKSAAARLLGISRRRLYSRLESLNAGEEPPEEARPPGVRGRGSPGA
jgi:two-component system, NtrC family, response regulator HydG